MIFETCADPGSFVKGGAQLRCSIELNIKKQIAKVVVFVVVILSGRPYPSLDPHM